MKKFKAGAEKFPLECQNGFRGGGQILLQSIVYYEIAYRKNKRV